jgi:hypothetical protein
LEILSNSSGLKCGSALRIFDLIKFLDLKKGPKLDAILLEINEAILSPKILNKRRSVIIIKN